jgi:putative Holliday junction resolvase
MRILGVDLGDARTGLALSDPTGFLASAVGTVREHALERVANAVAKAAKEHGAEKIVVGYPKNMNGTEGPRAEKTSEFARLLREVSGLEVILWDERYSTLSATRYMNETNTRGQKRKDNIDSLSAQIILQSYLDSQNK